MPSLGFSVTGIIEQDGHAILVRVDCPTLEEAIDLANAAQAEFGALLIEPTVRAEATSNAVAEAAMER